jgi:lysophospholipase L1-like esterase
MHAVMGFALSTLLAQSLWSAATIRDLSRGGTVLMLGDSILDIHEGEHRVEAVILRLAEQKTPDAKWTIYNEAHGGQYIGPKVGEPQGVSTPLFTTETTGRFFEIVARHPGMDAVIVNFAANDSKVYPPEHFRERLEALGELLERAYPGARLIFCASMYLDPAHSAPFHPGQSHVAGFRDGRSRNDYLEPYNNEIRRFTAAHGYVLVDTYQRIAAETMRGNWDLRLRRDNRGDSKGDAEHVGDMAWFDNIHPNDRGTAVIAQLLLDALTRPAEVATRLRVRRASRSRALSCFEVLAVRATGSLIPAERRN